MGCAWGNKSKEQLANLGYLKAKAPERHTKSSLMLGLGETRDEIFQAMQDMREVGVDFLTLGQYLQPTRNNRPVDRWVEPATFAHWKQVGLDLGFTVVESGPLGRSSYHAESQAQRVADGGDS